MQTIRRKEVKARKPHYCDLCSAVIRKGELHEVQTNVFDGKPYTWRTHIHCQSLCGKIWNYVDPDEGMAGDEFCDAVQDLISTFYCPFNCDEYDRETGDCDRGFDADVCVKRFSQFMDTRELLPVKDPDRGMCWRMVKMEGADNA